jgi:SAM-dependent methyltransferase
MIDSFLRHPLTRGLDLDDPRTTHLRREIIQSKPLLKSIYNEWYTEIGAVIPEGSGNVLEIGSGAGFFNETIDGLITSDTFHLPWLSVVMDAQTLPFRDQSLRAVVMFNVLHHIKNVDRFFQEASRCVRPSGVIAMIEPWRTRWSNFIYSYLHYEPFDADVEEWKIDSVGSLSGANDALPWIVFSRDRETFERKFSEWKVMRIKLDMPFIYLASGGVSRRSLFPGMSYPIWRFAEKTLSPWMDSLGMFALIVLEKQS